MCGDVKYYARLWKKQAAERKIEEEAREFYKWSLLKSSENILIF